MNTLFNPIDDTASEFAEITARLLGLYEVRPSQTPSKVTPKELLAGIEQFFGIAIQVERDMAGDLSDKDVTQIGEFALSMFVDLVPLTRQRNLKDFEL